MYSYLLRTLLVVRYYNNWILHNPGIGQPFNDVQLLTQAEQENNIWRSDTDPRLLT